jgi:hypothetical protein
MEFCILKTDLCLRNITHDEWDEQIRHFCFFIIKYLKIEEESCNN